MPTTRVAVPTVRAALGGGAVSTGSTTVRVIATRRTLVRGSGPGEISGPAVVFTVRVRNTAASAISLSSAVATAQVGGLPASPFEGPPATGWGDTLGAGQTRDVVLAFAAPESSAPVELMVSLHPLSPPVLLSGVVGASP